MGTEHSMDDRILASILVTASSIHQQLIRRISGVIGYTRLLQGDRHQSLDVRHQTSDIRRRQTSQNEETPAS